VSIENVHRVINAWVALVIVANCRSRGQALVPSTTYTSHFFAHSASSHGRVSHKRSEYSISTFNTSGIEFVVAAKVKNTVSGA